MPRKQDHGDEPRRLTDYMRAVRDNADPEEIARLRALYKAAVAERKARAAQDELDQANAEAARYVDA